MLAVLVIGIINIAMGLVAFTELTGTNRLSFLILSLLQSLMIIVFAFCGRGE